MKRKYYTYSVNTPYENSAPDACVFCARITASAYKTRNDHACVLQDAYPVTPGHVLIVPLRHEEDFFALSDEEMWAIWQLVRTERAAMCAADPTIDGCTIGVNNGQSAGQTVMHSHVHLIPRRTGDVPDPEGGIRAVIPSRKTYM